MFLLQTTSGTNGVHEVATFQMDRKVRDWPTILEDTEPLGRLSAGTSSPRTPSTIKEVLINAEKTVLERQSLRDPSTKPGSEKYQVLPSPNWFSTQKKLG